MYQLRAVDVVFQIERKRVDRGRVRDKMSLTQPAGGHSFPFHVDDLNAHLQWNTSNRVVLEYITQLLWYLYVASRARATYCNSTPANPIGQRFHMSVASAQHSTVGLLPRVRSRVYYGMPFSSRLV